MKIYVDIDNTITKTTDTDYKNAKPLKERIEKINKYYDEGHHITYWTARGTISKIDYTELTKQQLRLWGAKYHKLQMGKEAYDMFIDDKSFNSESFFKK